MPGGSLSYEHVAPSGSEKGMNCVTASCCSDMSGTDKRKLLFTGERAKPLFFKEIDVDSLPVLYYANKNA